MALSSSHESDRKESNDVPLNNRQYDNEISSSGATPRWTAGLIAKADEIKGKVDMVQVQIDSQRARILNRRAASGALNWPLQPVRKTIPGHPQGVQRPQLEELPEEFSVGDMPPFQLLPRSIQQIHKIEEHSPLDHIYWFYNDPSLAQYNKAGQSRSVKTRRDALELFVKF
ncbi:hypothetical protein R1flu_009256 [Riccia fluitans]|uniref:Uncharacterized protein n=1 Tax=Riccia fluitans TaxID=41844 RepID=A0ABD1Z1J6_9MARC